MTDLFSHLSGVTVGLQQTSYSVAEGNDSLSVCVVINRTAERDVVVSLVASSLTAQGRVYYTNQWLSIWTIILFDIHSTVSDDYAQPTPMELTIVAGTDQQCTSISISDDPILENDELFLVQLNTTDQAVTLRPSSANITIGDDDGKAFYSWHSKTCRNALCG